MTGNPCLALPPLWTGVGARPSAMSFGRAALPLLGALVPLLLWGCAPLPKPPEEATVRYIQIREDALPRDLYASVGDEVRWQNLTSTPVRLGLLGTQVLDRATCQQGFSRFGSLDDFVTIQPRGYVSLCFSLPGIVRYNVWLDADNPRGPMTPTGRIHLSPAS